VDCARIVDAAQSTAVACQRKKVMQAQIECRPDTLQATIAPRSSRNSRARWRAGFVVLALVGLSAGAALGEATNQIAAINPHSAAQGTTGLLVTFALDTDSPPAPPAGVMPLSVAISSISGGGRSRLAASVVIIGP